MPKLKNLKFNVGDDKELSKKVIGLLEGMGYSIESEFMWEGISYIYADEFGDINFGSGNGTFLDSNYEEVNIDWLRTPKEPEWWEDLKLPALIIADGDDGDLNVTLVEIDRSPNVDARFKVQTQDSHVRWVNEVRPVNKDLVSYLFKDES